MMRVFVMSRGFYAWRSVAVVRESQIMHTAESDQGREWRRMVVFMWAQMGCVPLA